MVITLTKDKDSGFRMVTHEQIPQVQLISLTDMVILAVDSFRVGLIPTVQQQPHMLLCIMTRSER